MQASALALGNNVNKSCCKQIDKCYCIFSCSHETFEGELPYNRSVANAVANKLQSIAYGYCWTDITFTLNCEDVEFIIFAKDFIVSLGYFLSFV